MSVNVNNPQQIIFFHNMETIHEEASLCQTLCLALGIVVN
jgi:hypothetical protein